MGSGNLRVKREQIVALVNRKGGSGKSTTTLNLAGALVDLGLRVLVVDLDPQASLTRLLTAEPVERGIGTCISAPGQLAAELIRDTDAGIDLLPGDRSIESAALALHDSPSGFLRLRRVLAPIAGYGVVLLDTPPALGFALSSAILAAGWAVLPTATTQQDIDALIDTLEAIEELAADELTCAQRLAIVPNGIHRDLPDQGGLAALQATFGDLVSQPVPHASAIKRALNRRLPLSRTEPRAAPMAAYRALGVRVAAAVRGGVQGRLFAEGSNVRA
jgi:chromosome partitioning protein